MVIIKRVIAGILAAAILYTGISIGKYIGRKNTIKEASLVFIGENEYVLDFNNEQHLYQWEGLGDYVRCFF